MRGVYRREVRRGRGRGRAGRRIGVGVSKLSYKG